MLLKHHLMKKILLPCLLIFLVVASNPVISAENDRHHDQYLIMLSMDGFRWDYADRTSTPNLDYIAQKGVSTEYVKPSFPSNTFPNHYTMVTGLHPDNHGLVNNSFYCPDMDMTYHMRDRDAVENGDFYGGEPIWVTAEKQNMTSASYFWVGSEAPVKGIQPTYWKEYNSSDTFGERIDTVMHWLQLPPEERPQLITFYFNQPDNHAHSVGPESPEIDELVTELDSIVGVLLDNIRELPVADRVNLIITSDHGMTERTPDRHVNVAEYVDRDWLDLSFGYNPMMMWRTKEGMTDSIYDILRDVENLHVWKTGELPERLKFGDNPRTLDLIVLADSAWNIGWGEPEERHYTGGGHGWDNAKKDMHTIFYAIGPAFKENHVHDPFELVDLYPLIADIMGLRPAPVDGKLERVEGMLK